MPKKILVPGGTGAMGVYLVPELLRLGYAVDVVSLDTRESCSPALRYITANFKKPEIRAEILKNDYDAIVDFMIYNTAEFEAVYRELLSSCEHYIYLSSYRAYGNEEHPIVETSPLLVDCSTDKDFLATEDYSLYKARGEKLLEASEFTNWTVIRPAITFSERRFQLVTLEANVVIHRTKLGKKLILPREAMGVQATMSWAGDVAKMISRLVLNRAAYREAYSVCTSEHREWREVAGYYERLIGLEYIEVSAEEYVTVIAEEAWRSAARYQLLYDRCFDRIMDNTKILTIAGMKQSELTTVYDGLKRELAKLPADAFLANTHSSNDRMDAFLESLK